MDLIMRAWQKAGDKSEVKEKEVVKIAKRWKEFVSGCSLTELVSRS